MNYHSWLKITGKVECNDNLKIRRLDHNPIITPDTSKTIGENINGPSLIRIPEWIRNPLGKYYLYFAHHNGTYIRLAYSDYLEGPWKIYEPGTLKIDQTICRGHIASPDVHIDNDTKQIRMYYHGPDSHKNKQLTYLALSYDGIVFKSNTDILGDSYFRVFKWRDYYYAMARCGQLYRSLDGLSNFESGHNPFDRVFYKSKVRHVAVYLKGECLFIFHSRIGDKPESIIASRINISTNWTCWKILKSEVILKPEYFYEGSTLPVMKSKPGRAKSPLNEVRDPAIYFENSKLYLVYSIAGESGLAISELLFY